MRVWLVAVCACGLARAQNGIPVMCKRGSIEIVEAWREVKIPERCERLDLTTHVADHAGGDRGARAIAEAIKHHPNIYELDLSGHNIGDEGAIHLADALRSNTVLKILDLYRNHIGDEGARAIADALHSNSVLVKLVIGNQRIGNKGAPAFADALERDDDPALRELNLSKNRIGAEGAAALAHAMMTRQKRQHPITIKGLEEAFHHGTHNEL